VRIAPATLGWKGFALLLALLAAFYATSYSNLFFLLIVFCCALGGLGALWTMQNLQGIQVVRVGIEPGPADSERSVAVRLHGRHQHFGLELGLCRRGEQQWLGNLDALRGTQDWQGTLPALPRGLSQWQLCVRSRLPFGLFTARLVFATPLAVVTYPAPIDGGADDDAGGAGRSGNPGQWSSGGGNGQVAGLRMFRRGDAPRDVHWKATARRGAPIVMEREAERDLLADVIVDRRDSELELALRRATTAVLASTPNRAVRLRSQGIDQTCCGAGQEQATALHWLAAAVPLPAAAEPPLDEGSGRGR
jgi:uncharacterized protein (DUF58 family)